jgi:hypothetical protein
MNFLRRANGAKLFWVATALLTLPIFFFPIDAEGAAFLKFLMVLSTPFVTLSLMLILGFLEILWEAFSPLIKAIKDWFLR